MFKAKILRKGNDSGVGGRSKGPGKTKRVKIGVKVEMIEFDQETCSVRVRGRNLTENPWIPVTKYSQPEGLMCANLRFARAGFFLSNLQVIDTYVNSQGILHNYKSLSCIPGKNVPNSADFALHGDHSTQEK